MIKAISEKRVWLPVAEVATELGISRPMVYVLINRGVFRDDRVERVQRQKTTAYRVHKDEITRLRKKLEQGLSLYSV